MALPPIETRPDLIEPFLSDAAHVPGGFAAGVALPQNAEEVAALVTSVQRLLPIGAQSSLTGGATPRGEVILNTRALRGVTMISGNLVRAGAGVSLTELQRVLAEDGLYYPPVPTFDGAFVGGTIATNAAGAATFKYGSTRQWIDGLTLVLADGSLLEIHRGEITASLDGVLKLQDESGRTVCVPVPSYQMPAVPKLSAGYFAQPQMDLVDLFVGSEGTLAIVVDATLRVIPMPRRAVALVMCESDQQALKVTAALRREATASWRSEGPLDVSAIEYIDARALAKTPDEAFVRAGVTRPTETSAVLLAQIEIPGADDPALQRLAEVLAKCGVDDIPYFAAPGDDRAARRLLELREAVPSAINALVASAKARVDPEIQKTAADLVVPFERLEESIVLYRRSFENRGLDYALWGHLSDGNLHPNVVPRSMNDVEQGREAILEMARGVIAMGGAPLAEHGVGRSALKQQLLRELYGDKGIDEMRAVKRALDPTWKLSPGVLFPESR
ncbi:MAG: FAD-binding oxidoreductase [Vicinamibacterales bacterium]